MLNVGNRRSRAWNRLHLIEPRSLSPDSRMPSYAQLFRDGDKRGPSLLEYLASLGEDTLQERIDDSRRWNPDPKSAPIGRSAQAALFQRSCAPCHGPGGSGDGPLAEFAEPSRPRNLRLGEWLFISRSSATPTTELARVIKFGITGTFMAGHETMTDSEVLGLAAYVQGLKGVGK